MSLRAIAVQLERLADLREYALLWQRGIDATVAQKARRSELARKLWPSKGT